MFGNFKQNYKIVLPIEIEESLANCISAVLFNNISDSLESGGLKAIKNYFNFPVLSNISHKARKTFDLQKYHNLKYMFLKNLKF